MRENRWGSTTEIDGLLFLSFLRMQESRFLSPSLYFLAKSNKSLPDLPWFFLVSVFISFSSFSNSGTFEKLTKTSLTDTQNSP